MWTVCGCPCYEFPYEIGDTAPALTKLLRVSMLYRLTANFYCAINRLLPKWRQYALTHRSSNSVANLLYYWEADIRCCVPDFAININRLDSCNDMGCVRAESV
jgi:hypothetical protein